MFTNKKDLPFWIIAPRAVKWFNYFYSSPKVVLPSLRVLLGKNKKNNNKPTIMTCSISEDYARVWLYFVQKNLDKDKWNFLIVDSIGDMDRKKFEGSDYIKFMNFYHGKKVDYLIRKYVNSDIVYLCDDDKYLLKDVIPFLDKFQNDKTAVVSLSPRYWWKFKIKDKEYLPMGSYSIIFNRKIFLDNRIKLESPTGVESEYKIFPPSSKIQKAYDTADFANEKLLLSGFNVKTYPDNDYVFGFDAMSIGRILLLRYGKEFIKNSLEKINVCKEGATDGGIMKSIYSIVKFERLYNHIFNEKPKFISGFNENELREVIENNSKLTEEQKDWAMTYFKKSDEKYEKLKSLI